MSDSVKTILIVDDEPDVLVYLATLLTDHGFQVLTAESGARGMELAHTHHPDLITLDLAMPSESGLRVYCDLLEEPITGNIPVLIVTGVSSEFHHYLDNNPHLSPPTAFFEKPIDREKFIETIRNILGDS